MKIQRLNAATRQQFTGPLPLTQLGQRPLAPCPISDVTSRRRPRRSRSPRHSHSDSALRSPTDLPTVAGIGKSQGYKSLPKKSSKKVEFVALGVRGVAESCLRGCCSSSTAFAFFVQVKAPGLGEMRRLVLSYSLLLA
ncbi:hypothetical protein KQX54_005757 [Cotesia glomerata]|uniref:Uncharacterized protein n=1 Tax=Cotesia glomerata TaxID=32391 RepID=A0AAV7I5T4_COTGL|nr:hypothetical protein KQX54_005757 [Cotesia glomerata]